jgi:hypothetical protein
MEFPQAICLTRDRGFALHVRQAIGLSCARITTVSDLGELSAKWCSGADLLLLDASFLEEEAGLLEQPETKLVLENMAHGETVLVAPAQLETCIEMLALPGCNNIIGGNPMSNSTELLTTIRKTRSSDVFGLKKYIPWGGYCFESRVSSLIDKRNVVSWVAATAHRVGCARWLTVELEIATDELLSNAIYPADMPDEERFQAGPVDSALLRWACSEGCIHVSVTDQRGTFEKQTLINALHELASAPADELSLLGLPRQITLAQRLVVNVVPEVCSEMIISVPLRGRKTSVPTIGFYATPESPDETAATAAEPMTINLNGRLVIETLGLECEVSIHEINALRAEVTVEEPITQSIYPGVHFTLAVNVPFHGELKASGLIFRVQETQPIMLSLSFATGYQEWERVVRSVLGKVPGS